MASALLQVFAAFLASSVEMVEALTIILAVGVTRSWRPALLGMTAGLVALAAVVGALGPSLSVIPIDGLRMGVGVLLTIFGLQWLRKAMLRSAGLKAKHNEAQIFDDEVEYLAEIATTGAFDWTGFTVAFKGVFLEGLEVAFIVLTFGANEGRYDLPIVGAAAGLVIVAIAGVALQRPLSRVPENAIKFSEGLLLTAFGTFWVGEGLGVDWLWTDASIPLLLVLYSGVAFLALRVLHARGARPVMAPVSS